ARRVGRKLEALMSEFQATLQPLAHATTPMARETILAQGAAVLERGFELGRWQFLVALQLHAQLGQLYYIQQKFKEAQPHLEKAFSRLWLAHAMLACLHFKKKRYDEMKRAFEGVAKHAKKESLF